VGTEAAGVRLGLDIHEVADNVAKELAIEP
jgi:hypothetical protein